MAGYTTLQLSIIRGDNLRAIRNDLPGLRGGCPHPVCTIATIGGSALLLAVEQDRVEVVELLLDDGADVGILKPNGAHALALAAEFCQRDARTHHRLSRVARSMLRPGKGALQCPLLQGT